MNTLLNFTFSPSGLFLMQAPPAQDPAKSLIGMVGPMILIFVVFYLIAIRPQQKQQKELAKAIDALKVGDRVLTTSSIFGIVSQIKDKTFVIKIAENTKIEMLRSGIQQVLPDEKKD